MASSSFAIDPPPRGMSPDTITSTIRLPWPLPGSTTAPLLLPRMSEGLRLPGEVLGIGQPGQRRLGRLQGAGGIVDLAGLIERFGFGQSGFGGLKLSGLLGCGRGGRRCDE